MRNIWTLLFTAWLVSSCGDGVVGIVGNGDAGGSLASDDARDSDNADVGLRVLDARASGTQPMTSVLLRANDSVGNPLPNLTTGDFLLTENGEALSAEASYLIDDSQWLDYQQRVVVAVDVSASMSQLGTVRTALQNTLSNRLKSQQTVSIAIFDDNLTTLTATATNSRSVISRAISQITSNGVASTDLNGTLLALAGGNLSQFSIDGIHMSNILVITDGADTAGRSSLKDTIAMLPDGAVHIIDLNPQSNDSATLKLLATGGYFAAPSGGLYDALGSAWNAIDNFAASHYKLQYFTAKRWAVNSDNVHRLGVSVVGSGEVSLAFTAPSDGAEASLQINGPESAVIGQQVALQARVLPPPSSTSSRLVTWKVSNDFAGVCRLANGGDGLNQYASVTMLTTGECWVTASFFSDVSGEPLHEAKSIVVTTP